MNVVPLKRPKLPDDHEFAPLNLQLMLTRLLEILVKREVVSESGAFEVMYYDRRESSLPNSSIVGVHASNLRKRLRPYGIEIKTKNSVGWYITPEHKEKLAVVLDTLRSSEQQKADLVRKAAENAIARANAYLIEDDVPLPTRNSGHIKYRFADLKNIGQSFILLGADRERVSGAAQAFRNRNGGKYRKWKFDVRDVPGGVRVWRRQ